ncbi:putative ATP-dependent helicase [Lachnospiraceae bacterium TWA4]|nr:putative ATP-dependent helicase [Lachnospiraceae bacterium TWA4]
MDELFREKDKLPILEEGKVLRYGYVRDEQLNKNPYVSSFCYTVSKNPDLHKKLDFLQAEYDKIKHTKGYNSKNIIEVRKEIGRIRGQIRDQERHNVEKASIVATTISKVIMDPIFENKKYDVVMFDEVSMAYILQVVCAATFCKEHFICVGDFKQLSPIAQSKAKEVLCKDIFEFIGINQYGKPYYHPWLVMLDEQRRMHPKISEFSNKYVYSRLLKNHVSTITSRGSIVDAPLFKKEPINFIDLSGCHCAAAKNTDNSRYNILSAFISFAAAVQTEKNVDNVSIITPYAAQTRLIRALTLDYRQKNTTKIRCATVHQFQGSESDVIYFDAVESYPSKKPGWLMGKDFYSIERLINVAVTRAKGKLVTVANHRFWERNYKNNSSHMFYRLLIHSIQNGNRVEFIDKKTIKKLVKKLSLKDGPEFYLMPEEYLDLVQNDLENAKSKIIVSLPCGELLMKYEEKIFNGIQKAKLRGVQVFIKSNDYANLPEKWKVYACRTDNAIFPILMIDDQITWYGVPLAPWKFVDRDMTYKTICPIVCRVKGKYTAEMIKSLSNLEYRNMNGEENLNNLEEVSGFKGYIQKYKKCLYCKKPLILTKGKSRKTILWCKECKKVELVKPDDINHYILVNHVKCPRDGWDITAKVGPYGIYIECDGGHSLKVEEI